MDDRLKYLDENEQTLLRKELKRLHHLASVAADAREIATHPRRIREYDLSDEK